MASDRDSTNPLIDIAAVVISPALIMLMVGSLVFFLIEVLYQGQYSGRLLWTMFFFVFGAVLLARLSIQFGRAYAALYAAGLGGACFVALMTFVEYPSGPMKTLGPVVNLLLMALVWWSADKLTWDCTHFDDERKASGRGVLAAAGLSEDDAADEPEDSDEADTKKKGKRPAGFVGWVERFQEYREAQRKKAHTPGVWVLYFSLAALPLFALGQSLISPDDAETRRATFFQMAVYVGSGLGLLVTTTLFGLKRYLEQRNARIPAVMTAGWLGLGLGLIVLFLAVGAVLPRPHSETPWFGMKRGGQSQRDASRYAVVRDKSAGKGEGAAGEKTEAGQGKNSAKGGEQKGGNGGEKGSGGGKGNSKGGQKSDKGEQGKGQQGDKQKQGESQNSSRSSDSKSSDQKRRDAKSGEQSREADKNRSGSDRSSSGTNRLSQMMQSIGSFVKWVVWILVAAAVIVGVVVFVLKWLAPFTNWAQGLLDWLRGLFARKRSTRERDEEEIAASAGPTRPPSFAAFSNPFTDRSANRREPAELLEYTFAAFDSWAWDRGRGRQPGETPLEFAIRIGNEFEDVDEPAFRVANLYVRLLYSRSQLPADTRQTLEALWDQLESSSSKFQVPGSKSEPVM